MNFLSFSLCARIFSNLLILYVLLLSFNVGIITGKFYFDQDNNTTVTEKIRTSFTTQYIPFPNNTKVITTLKSTRSSPEEIRRKFRRSVMNYKRTVNGLSFGNANYKNSSKDDPRILLLNHDQCIERFDCHVRNVMIGFKIMGKYFTDIFSGLKPKRKYIERERSLTGSTYQLIASQEYDDPDYEWENCSSERYNCELITFTLRLCLYLIDWNTILKA